MKAVEKEFREFCEKNRDWLEGVVGSPSRPKVLRVMAGLVLAEGEGEIDLEKEIGGEQNQDGPKNEEVSL